MPRAESALSQAASQIPPGSLRHSVVQAARRFKSTWVELGKLLINGYEPTAVKSVSVFKSVGVAVQDWALARLAVERSRGLVSIRGGDL